MIDENFQKQADIFLENDPHAKDILTLFDCLIEAYKKIKPTLQEVTQKRYETNLIEVRRNVSVYLNKHMEATVKAVNATKNN